jgi:hypothetical protein
MRNCTHIYLIEFESGKIRRVKDNGDVVGATCYPARRTGFDQIIHHKPLPTYGLGEHR